MSIVELGDGPVHVPSEALIVEVGAASIQTMSNPQESSLTLKSNRSDRLVGVLA